MRTAPLDGLVEQGFRIAGELGLSVYDTLYLALAEARVDPLLTWDKRLLRSVQGSRFAALTVPLARDWER